MARGKRSAPSPPPPDSATSPTVTPDAASSSSSDPCFLRGLQLCFSPAAVKSPNYRTLQSSVEKAGGVIYVTVAKKVTLFIATQEEVDAVNPAAKLKQVQKRNQADGDMAAIEIVSEQYLARCLSESTIVAPQPFRIKKGESNVISDSTDAKNADSDSEPDSTSKASTSKTASKRKSDVLDTQVVGQKKQKLAKDERDKAAAGATPDEESKSQEPKQPEEIVKMTKKGKTVVDHLVPGGSGMHVFVDDQGNVYDVMLNQTEIAHNNNKFFIIQLLRSDTTKAYSVWTRWGRVGNNGQSSLHGAMSEDAAIHFFNKKFSEKTKNKFSDRDHFVKHPGKYFLMERDFGDDEPERTDDTTNSVKSVEKKHIPDTKLKPSVADIIGLIFNIQMMEQTMSEIGYDVRKMPLGKMTKAHIAKGYETLKRLSEVLSSNTRDPAELSRYSSEFYTIIPHNFGRNRPTVIDSAQLLKSKLEMVQSLADIEIATTMLKRQQLMDTNPLDTNYASLNCAMDPVGHQSETFKLIQDYVKNTHADTHSTYKLDVLEVFDLCRAGEDDRFKKDMPNRKLLWHGSRLTNYVGILSQGLRIAPPEAPVTGYMFGKGVYFADMVSKSANYCFTSRAHSTGLLLLCEVALGKEKTFENASYDAHQVVTSANCHSAKGCGGTAPDSASEVTLPDGVVVPCGKATNVNSKSRTSLLYNEYIVYDTSQIRMRYLLKVNFQYLR